MGTILITGPTSGIGRAAAHQLASLGHHVVAAGRNPAKLKRLVYELNATGGSAEPLLVDLASLASVSAAAAQFVASGRNVDVLVNNAGVGMASGTTVDGFAVQFGVNHLAHFLLTAELGPALRPGSRVIQVASQMHHRASGIDFHRVTRPARTLKGVEQYSVSKLANLLFVAELARRRPDLVVHAVHPGLVKTSILPWFVRPFIRGITPEEGAEVVTWCATAAEPGETTGGYWARRRPIELSETARDPVLAQELWRRSEEWCAPFRTH
jgi:retinol dehydrogenase 12